MSLNEINSVSFFLNVVLYEIYREEQEVRNKYVH